MEQYWIPRSQAPLDNRSYMINKTAPINEMNTFHTWETTANDQSGRQVELSEQWI